MREIQDFKQEYISMSPTPLTQTTELKKHFNISLQQNGKDYFTISPEQNGNEHITISPQQNRKGNVKDDPDPDPSFSESTPKKKKQHKMKNRGKHRKYWSSDPSSSGDSDSSNDSDYRSKRRKIKSNQKKDLIKLCAHLTAKLLTATYKSKIIRYKKYEDPLQRRIYFLTFVESPEMTLSQYTETCEVLLDYP